MTLCKAFSSSKGYFFLCATSLNDSSRPDITVGSPLYPKLPTRNRLWAVVLCKPLQPEIAIIINNYFFTICNMEKLPIHYFIQLIFFF